MKNLKKILAIAVAAIMLLSLSACGVAELPLLKAGTELLRSESVHIEPEGEVTLKLGVPSFDLSMDLEIGLGGGLDLSREPLRLAGELTIQAMGEDSQILIELEEVDGELVARTSEDGGETWDTETVGEAEEVLAALKGLNELEVSDLIEFGNSFGGALSDFTRVGVEEVNGARAARYDAALSFETLLQSEQAQEAFSVGMSTGLGELENSEALNEIDFSTLEELYFSLWLDEDSGALVKAELDMGDTMRSFFETGILDALIAQQAGLEGMEYSIGVETLRLALVFSEAEGAVDFSPIGGKDVGTAVVGGGDVEQAALSEGSLWYGTLEVANHSGKAGVENGSYEVWGYLGSGSEGLYFELYESPDVQEASPILSYWARIEGSRIIPVIGEEDAWFINIYLNEEDTEELGFTLENGELTASYFYYDGSVPEAFDVSIVLVPTEG